MRKRKLLLEQCKSSRNKPCKVNWPRHKKLITWLADDCIDKYSMVTHLHEQCIMACNDVPMVTNSKRYSFVICWSCNWHRLFPNFYEEGGQKCQNLHNHLSGKVRNAIFIILSLVSGDIFKNRSDYNCLSPCSKVKSFLGQQRKSHAY